MKKFDSFCQFELEVIKEILRTHCERMEIAFSNIFDGNIL